MLNQVSPGVDPARLLADHLLVDSLALCLGGVVSRFRRPRVSEFVLPGAGLEAERVVPREAAAVAADLEQVEEETGGVLLWQGPMSGSPTCACKRRA